MIPLPNRSAAAIAVAVAVSAAHAAALAAPASNSAYATERQETYVFDQINDAIGTTNMITCLIGTMNPAALVNQGPYVALIDKNKCDSRSQADASNSTGSAAVLPDYVAATMHSTRASNSEPMRARGWLSFPEEGQIVDVALNLSAAQAPSSANPYGQFRLDFCGQQRGAAQPGCRMRGLFAGSAEGLEFAEQMQEEGQQYSTRLYLTTGANDTGAGAIELVGNDGNGAQAASFRFAYDGGFFRRSDGNQTMCFDRRLSQAASSVWRYGVYDENGARVEREAGFPISFTAGGQTYRGYAGYYGLSMPPVAMAALANGATVERPSADGGGATGYTAVRVAGRLTRHVKKTRSIGEFAGSRFMFMPWNGLSAQTIAAIDASKDDGSIRGVQLEAYFDADAKAIRVTAMQTCGESGGCVSRSITPVSLSGEDLARYDRGLFGHSRSFGGEVSLPQSTLESIAAGAPAGDVVYREVELVYPGAADAPTTLYCAANCPTGAAIAAVIAGTASSPYALEHAWSGADAPVQYAFAATGMLVSESGDAAVPLDANVQQLPGALRHGIRSGRLVESAGAIACAHDATRSCDHSANAAPVYYTWESGPNNWSQFFALKSGSQYVKFDAPLTLDYTVPADPARFGEHAGTTILLQYAGQGQLWGVPGHCVSAASNAPVSCDTAMARWVPSFTIPADAIEGAARAGGKTYLIKWLAREVRLARVPDSSCASLSLGDPSKLPALSKIKDPTDPQSDIYVGTQPVLAPDVAPRVIDGIVKY